MGWARLSSRIRLLLVFLVVLLVQVVFMFQGLDLTDLGWHLTDQMRLVEYSEFGSLDWSFPLSNCIGGLWLLLPGSPSVLWARLGGALIGATNAGLVYSILSRHFDRGEVALLAIGTGVLISGAAATMIIDYFTFPALVLSIELWLLDRLLNRPSSKERSVCGFLMGALLILSVFGRMTLLLMAAFPISLLLYGRITEVEIDLNGVCVWIIAGALASSAAVLGSFWAIGILRPLLDQISSVLLGQGELAQHDIGRLLTLYLADARRIVARTSILVALGYGIWRIRGAKGSKVAICVASVVVLSGLLVGVELSELGIIKIRLAREISRVFTGLVSLALGLSIIRGEDRSAHLDILSLGALWIMLLTPMGSNTGFHKSLFGMWVALPLAVLRTGCLAERSQWRFIKEVYKHLRPVCVGLLAFSLVVMWFSVYRDANRLELTSSFSHPALFGIFSTSERTVAVDGIVSSIENRTRKGDMTLLVNYVPLLYYLTETRPALKESWPFLLSLDSIEKLQSDLEDLPRLFGYAKGFPGDPTWPRQVDGVRVVDREKLEFLSEIFLENLGYDLAYESDEFVLYCR